MNTVGRDRNHNSYFFANCVHNNLAELHLFFRKTIPENKKQLSNGGV
jgi:hypothetical protein